MMNQSIRSQVRDHNPFDLPNVEIPDNVEEVILDFLYYCSGQIKNSPKHLVSCYAHLL